MCVRLRRNIETSLQISTNFIWLRFYLDTNSLKMCDPRVLLVTQFHPYGAVCLNCFGRKILLIMILEKIVYQSVNALEINRSSCFQVRKILVTALDELVISDSFLVPTFKVKILFHIDLFDK